MRIFLYLALVILFGINLSVSAQSSLLENPGINYQGIIFDPEGKVHANLPISVKINFATKGDSAQVFYTETHKSSTNESGVFTLVLGKGGEIQGQLNTIPWSAKKIYIDVAIQSTNHVQYSAFHSTPIQAVPYAHYAARAATILQQDSTLSEKSQSIRWTTSGNEQTNSNAHFLGTRDAQNLVIKTNSTTNAVIASEGQVKIYGRTSGQEDDYKAYPLYVEGSDQGVFILVNGKRSNENNFVQFRDNRGKRGEIQGQTKTELGVTFDFAFKQSLFAANALFLAEEAIGTHEEAAGLSAAAGAAASSLFFIFAAPGFAAAGAALFLRGAAIVVEAGAFAYEVIQWNKETINEIGVEYSSGSGDYAEYLERSPGVSKLQGGQIVGVKGGKVSLNTIGADQILVISAHPIILGNAPQPNREDDFEKIAFLGQVDVRVSGKVNIGDYILASGNNDGIGVAMAPESLQPLDYRRVVGVAWEEAPDRPLNKVRIGVGLNKNDLAAKVDEAEQKLNNIVAYLEGKGPLRPDEPQSNIAVHQGQQVLKDQSPSMSHEEFDRFVDESAQIISTYYTQANRKLLDQGVKIPEEFEPLFKDPVNTIKKMHRDPMYKGKWGALEEKLRAIH